MKKYIKIIFLMSFSLLTLSANSVQEGKKIYLEADCKKCHLQDEKFDPNSIKKEGLVSKVKDKKGIHKWVVDCDVFFNVGWFPEEHDAVTEYLNSVYYKFKENNSTTKK